VAKPGAGRDIDDIDDGDEVVLGKERVVDGGEDQVQARHNTEPDADDIEVVLAEHDKQDAGDETDGDGDADGDADGDIDSDADAEADAEAERARKAALQGEDDDASYSEKVRKRIARERRLRIEAEDALAAERIEREKAQVQNLGYRKTLVDTTLVNIDGLIAKAQADMKKAIEAGETDKQVEAQGQLSDLQGRKRELENAKARLEAEVTAGADSSKPENNPLTKRWLGKNQWFADPKFKEMAAAVRGFDSVMVSEGFRPTSEAYYIELDRRIKRNLPQLQASLRKAGYVAAPRTESTSTKRGTALPANGGGGNGGARTTAGKRRVVLTRADLETMEGFGLDPNDSKARVEFARQKLALG